MPSPSSAISLETAYFVNGELPCVALIAKGVRFPPGKWVRLADGNVLPWMAEQLVYVQLRDHERKEQIGDPGHRFARLDPRERTFLLQHRALGSGQTARAFRELLDQAPQRGSHLRGKAG